MAHSVLAFASGATTAFGVALALDALIKGFVVLLAVGGVAFAMRRSSAAMRHLVWTVGLLSLLLMPLISLAVPRWEVLPEWLRAESIVYLVDAQSGEQVAKSPRYQSVASANLLQHEIVAAIESSPIVHSDAAPDVASDVLHRPDDVRPASAGAWLTAGVWIWAVVAGVLLLRIVLSRIILARVVKTASRIDDGPIHSQIVNVQRRYNIPGKVHAFASGKRALPMTWGLFRTHILLPADAVHWPADRLEAVLLHELAHVKRRDTITHIVGQFACALYWINPLVWLAAWRIHIERECACDDLVVGSGVKSSDYAEHLLRIVGKCRNRRAVPCSAVGMAKASRLEGRLMAILNDRLNRRSATKGFFATVLVAGCVGVIAVAMLQAQSQPDAPGSGEANPQESRDESAESESAKRSAAAGTTDPKTKRLVNHVNAFLDAVLSEKYDEAAKLAGPEFPRGQLDDFARLSVDNLTAETLYVASADALAITSPLSVDDASGKRVGRLVLTWEQRAEFQRGDILGKVEKSWQLRDVDFETGASLQRKIARFLEDFPNAVRVEVGATFTRRFIRLVIGPDDKMTFEGRATTWQELPTALANVPHSASTVLEYAISTEQLTVAQLKQIQLRAAVLAKEHGFEYASYVGVHPLGSVGSPAATRDDSNENSSDPPIKFSGEADERFDPAVRLAGLTAGEASTLDKLLRSRKFDGFDALKAYDPTEYVGDVATLRSALVKLFALEEKQSAELNRIEEQLQSSTLSEAGSRLLEDVRRNIKHQSARKVLSIRQVFRPDPAGDARANWSALSKWNLADGKERYMASARAPVGGEFPVRFQGEDQERFRVRVLDGDDDALMVRVFFEIDGVPIEPVQDEFRLTRDRLVEFDVNGERFSLLYPSTYIARSGPATTDLAQIIVSYHPDSQPRTNSDPSATSNE